MKFLQQRNFISHQTRQINKNARVVEYIPCAKGEAEVFFAIKRQGAFASLNGDPDFMGLLNKDDIYED